MRLRHMFLVALVFAASTAPGTPPGDPKTPTEYGQCGKCKAKTTRRGQGNQFYCSAKSCKHYCNDKTDGLA